MFFLSLRSDFNDENFMVKLPFISFLEYMHDFVCAMHVTAQEFASLWRSSESPGVVFKQGIMYLL